MPARSTWRARFMCEIRVEGLSEQRGEIRRFGLFQEGGIARQFLLGVAQTAEGWPIGDCCRSTTWHSSRPWPWP